MVRHAVVIPAFAEGDGLVPALASLPRTAGPTAAIVVVNAPKDATADERRRTQESLEALASAKDALTGITLLLVERTSETHPLPRKEGVGRARKIGFDLAIRLFAAGKLQSRFIHTTDADVRLPATYLSATDRVDKHAVAVTYPFEHAIVCPGDEAYIAEGRAYDAYLQHYVDGLRYAGSPYAYHTVGSTLAIDVEAYAAVRGMPKRAAGEDFHVLNKLRKLGPIDTVSSDPLRLSCRPSERTPYGTGQKVREWSAGAPMFYHPQVFAGLRRVLDAEPEFRGGRTPEFGADALGRHVRDAVDELGIRGAVARAQTAARTPAQRKAKFDLTLDALQTLRLIHGLERRGYEKLPDRQLPNSD